MIEPPISLIDLEAHFIKIIDEKSHRKDASFDDCDGIFFLCPLCFLVNEGSVGTHGGICWKPGVPAETQPGPGRWPHSGTGLHDLTLTPSIQLVGGCNWHGFIQNGYAVQGLEAGDIERARAFNPTPMPFLVGRRVPGFDWHEWMAGDYGYSIEDNAWIGITPNGHPANLGSHQVTELDNGTITVSPSIKVSTSRRDKDVELWHGYLELGIWRKA